MSGLPGLPSVPGKRKLGENSDGAPRRRTKKLKMNKTKPMIPIKTFDEVIEEVNREFLQTPEKIQEMTEELEKERTENQRYRGRLTYLQRYQESMLRQQEIKQKLTKLTLRHQQLLYTHRLCQFLLFFFDKSPDLENRLLRVDVLKRIHTFLTDCLEGTPTEELIKKVTPALDRILLELTKHVINHRHCPFPYSPDYKAQSVRVFALPIPVLNKTLEEAYMWQFASEHTAATTVQKDICEFCHKALLLQRKESLQTCKCSAQTYTFFNLSNHDIDYSKSNSTVAHDYERRKFFERWLSQFKEGSKKIPDNVLMMVKRELLNMQITSKLDVKMTTVKNILVRLNLQSYINNANKIANILNDVEIAEFSNEQFKEIMERTKVVEEMYMYFKRNPHPELRRENFPGFKYFVRQICMINKWQTLKRRFKLPLLETSREVQEKEWKIYISYLKRIDSKHVWKFIPTR